MTELEKKRWTALFAMAAWIVQAAYVLFPFDLLPDFIPVLGWLDDLVALGGLAATTLWMVKIVSDAGLERLVDWNEPTIIESEPYEPIPDDILRAL